MHKRFEYDHMTPSELQTALDEHQIKPGWFCRIFGTNEKTMQKWLSGENNIPHWVPVTLAMFFCNETFATAKDESGYRLRFDNSHPDRGEYPYQNGSFDEEEE